MNLFCFTLEGSTDSIYEPAYSHTLKEVLPKCQCSPALLRQKTEWGGSDPCITSGRPQSTVKGKRKSRRSCVPTSSVDNQTLETRRAPCQSSLLARDDGAKETNPVRTQTRRAAQDSETAADTEESTHATGRLKKLQSLVQTKRGHQREKSSSDNNEHLADVLSNSNAVLTCMGLGRRTEKKASKGAPSPPPLQQQQQQAQHVHQDSEEEAVWPPRLGNYLWSPFECPQPWPPFYHTCHQPQHELWVCGGTLSLPHTTEWDRFESLIQELDSKQPDLSPPPAVCSVTELQLPQNTLTRFGRFDAFRQHSPLMRPQDNGCSLRSVDPSTWRLQGREMETSSHSDRKHIGVSQKTLTAINKGNTGRDEAEKRDAGGGGPFTRGHRRSTNSLESLYSHNSGQSSSSGVTSGSDCSSNRNSVRLDDEPLSTRQFCGRARAHTDFVPSPYDTESLTLKVGDVIDIIAKSPMGIWTGMLKGKMGNFKFIYVDVLAEDSPYIYEETQPPRVRQKSTVQEVLKHLSLEEYSSCLQLHGYQTVDDLMRLREHHLTELNVTDPEHRHRLLAAVDSLQQLHSDIQAENGANQEAETPSENIKAEMNNCPRDSGCHMPSDSSDNSTEDADFTSEYPLLAEPTTS